METQEEGALPGHLNTGLHKTGIRGIQDNRQIVDSKTNDIANDDKEGDS